MNASETEFIVASRYPAEHLEERGIITCDAFSIVFLFPVICYRHAIPAASGAFCMRITHPESIDCQVSNSIERADGLIWLALVLA